jgi:hypothetical protein
LSSALIRISCQNYGLTDNFLILAVCQEIDFAFGQRLAGRQFEFYQPDPEKSFSKLMPERIGTVLMQAVGFAKVRELDIGRFVSDGPAAVIAKQREVSAAMGRVVVVDYFHCASLVILFCMTRSFLVSFSMMISICSGLNLRLMIEQNSSKSSSARPLPDVHGKRQRL